MKTLCLQKHGLFQPLLIIVVLIFSSCVLTSQTNTAEVGDILYYEGFESTNSLQQNGTATIALSDVYAAAGDKSLSVEPVADNN